MVKSLLHLHKNLSSTPEASYQANLDESVNSRFTKRSCLLQKIRERAIEDKNLHWPLTSTNMHRSTSKTVWKQAWRKWFCQGSAKEYSGALKLVQHFESFMWLKWRRRNFQCQIRDLILHGQKIWGKTISYRTRGEDLSGMKSYHNKQQKKEKMIPCKTGLVELFAFWYLVFLNFLKSKDEFVL